MSTLQHTAPHRNTSQHTLQHTAKHTLVLDESTMGVHKRVFVSFASGWSHRVSKLGTSCANCDMTALPVFATLPTTPTLEGIRRKTPSIPSASSTSHGLTHSWSTTCSHTRCSLTALLRLRCIRARSHSIGIPRWITCHTHGPVISVCCSVLQCDAFEHVRIRLASCAALPAFWYRRALDFAGPS